MWLGKEEARDERGFDRPDRWRGTTWGDRGAIAQFERELIRERMLVGIAKAKAEGKYKGRAPTARAQAEKVRQLQQAGVGPSEIARQVGISRTSVFRILTAA